MKKQKIVILTATLLGIILLSIAAFVFFGTKPVYENKTIEEVYEKINKQLLLWAKQHKHVLVKLSSEAFSFSTSSLFL